MAIDRLNAEAIDIAVFARAPVAGRCKTRLIPALGPDGAAALHRRMIERTIACAMAADTGSVALWCTPDATHPLFARLAEANRIALHVQTDGDLGARMSAAFAAQPAGRPLLLIGTDCPALTSEHLQACAVRLRQGDDAVFVPTEDGGYCLVGLRMPQPALFDAMPWSTAHVMSETRRRLDRAGLRWQTPATLWDVDTPQDLARLRASGLIAMS
jgi:rSAM/selenodomain-associated transferase 1